MENKSSSPISILRWIVFLPGAPGAAWLAWVLINILGRFSLGYVGIQSNSFLGQFYFNTAGQAAMGAAFVFVGAYIAPYHRKFVAYCLAGIGFVISGFMLFPAIMVKNYWAIWGSLCVVLGVGAVTYSIYQGEIKTD